MATPIVPVVNFLQSPADQLASQLAAAAPIVSQLVTSYNQAIIAQGGTPDLSLAGAAATLAALQASAQQVASQYDALQGQVAQLQKQLTTSTPPAVQGNPGGASAPASGYSGGTVAGAGVGGAALGFLGGWLARGRKR